MHKLQLQLLITLHLPLLSRIACRIAIAPARASAHILNLLSQTVVRAEIQLQRAAKQLEQDLKADFRNGWIVAALGEFVADECVCKRLLVKV